jgi:hypothetical protein
MGSPSSGSGQGFQTATRPLVAFGSAPLFVYVLHLYLYMLMGRTFAPLGSSLQAMYLYWLAGLALLYLPALWYGRLRQLKTPLRGITWRFYRHIRSPKRLYRL